jgi:DNA-binding transcriptional ArsR family regulator
MTPSESQSVDPRIVKALGHPLRQRILHALSERVCSPKQVADELGEPLGNVSYHVRILLAHEAIELVDTRPVRGAIEHFYRATIRPFFDDTHWAQLPPASRRALFGQTLEQIGKHVRDAAIAGGFDRLETHVTWTPLKLDAEGWTELSAKLVELLDEAARIEAESLTRLAGAEPGDAGPIRSELAMMHFERVPVDGADTPARTARTPARAEQPG